MFRKQSPILVQTYLRATPSCTLISPLSPSLRTAATLPLCTSYVYFSMGAFSLWHIRRLAGPALPRGQRVTEAQDPTRLAPTLPCRPSPATALPRPSSSPPASAVSSPPHRRAGRRRPRPGSPWPSPAPGAWGLRRALVP